MPIILHGRSGTGKTISLGFIAYAIRKQQLASVLFIPRQSKLPVYNDLDSFCQWSEENTNQKTLVVWDGMVDIEQYNDLLHFLNGRGRKIILVGSSYSISEDTKDVTKHKKYFIKANSQLTNKEKERFVEYLNNIDPDISENVLKRIDLVDEHFWVALYHLLPPSKVNIQKSINDEVINAEKILAEKATSFDVQPATAMAYALLEAGIVKDLALLSKEKKEISGDELSEIQELIGLIMVPGKFGLRVPLDLLVSALNKDWMLNFIDILREVDIFSWFSDDYSGNIYLGARHPLEARLLVQSRLGNAITEFHFAQRLIEGIKENESSDIDFIIDLVRNMGANGPYSNYYQPIYKKLSDCLTHIREKKSIQNPRLMLQEANLRREAVLSILNDEDSKSESIKILDECEKILAQAIDLATETSHRIKSALLVEMGAVLALKSQILDSINEVIPFQIFVRARNYLIQAIKSAPEDFHPYDVLYWMSAGLIKDKAVPNKNKNEILSDLVSVFSLADPEDFSAIQTERYYKRAYQTGQLVGNMNLTEAAFDELIKMGSTAGYYLKAYNIAGELPYEREFNHDECKRALGASNYLRNNLDAIKNDSKGLYLLLKYYWIGKSGRLLLFGERNTLPLKKDEWSFIYRIINQLLLLDIEFSIHKLFYLKGISEFHLGLYGQAIQTFRDLEKTSNNIKGRRRIIRTYIASNEDGTPMRFSGTVTWVSENNSTGELHVDQIRNTVRFLPYEYHSWRTLNKNDSIDNFHIAFNMIGILADPEFQFGKNKK